MVTVKGNRISKTECKTVTLYTQPSTATSSIQGFAALKQHHGTSTFAPNK